MQKKYRSSSFLFPCVFLFVFIVFFIATNSSISYTQKKESIRIFEQLALFLSVFFVIITWFRPAIIGFAVLPQNETRTIKPYVILVPLLFYIINYSLSAFHSLYLQNQDFTNISTAINHSAKGLGVLRTAYLETGSSGSYLGHHFSPILFFLVPFYFFSHIITQAPLSSLLSFCYMNTHFLYAILLAVIYVSGLALWIRYSLKKVGKSLTYISILYFLFLPISLHLMASFHFEIFVIPLSAFFFLQLDKKKINLTLVFSFVLLCLIKEDISLYFLFFGFYLLSHKKSFQKGLLIISISAVYFISVKFFIIPWFADYQSIPWENYWSAAAPIAIPSRLKPSLMILLSSGFLLIFQLRYFVIVICPLLLLHATSNHLYHQSFLGHYGYTIIPFVFYGIVNGIKRIRNIQESLQIPILKTVVGIGVAFLFYVASFDRLSPFPSFPIQKNTSQLQHLLSKIPQKSCIFSQSNLSPHLPLHSIALPLSNPSRNYYQYEVLNVIKKIKLGYSECKNNYILLSSDFFNANDGDSKNTLLLLEKSGYTPLVKSKLFFLYKL